MSRPVSPEIAEAIAAADDKAPPGVRLFVLCDFCGVASLAGVLGGAELGVEVDSPRRSVVYRDPSEHGPCPNRCAEIAKQVPALSFAFGFRDREIAALKARVAELEARFDAAAEEKP